MSHAASKYVKNLTAAPAGEKITRSEKLLLCLLADDHNEDKGCAWPSVKNLADRACMTRDNCRRLLRRLESMGLIEANPRLRENGSRSASEYRFCDLDPAFNAREAARTAKRIRLQDLRRAQRPVQLGLAPKGGDSEGYPRTGAGVGEAAETALAPRTAAGVDPSTGAGPRTTSKELPVELPETSSSAFEVVPREGEKLMMMIPAKDVFEEAVENLTRHGIAPDKARDLLAENDPVGVLDLVGYLEDQRAVAPRKVANFAGLLLHAIEAGQTVPAGYVGSRLRAEMEREAQLRLEARERQIETEAAYEQWIEDRRTEVLAERFTPEALEVELSRVVSENEPNIAFRRLQPEAKRKMARRLLARQLLPRDALPTFASWVRDRDTPAESGLVEPEGLST